MKQNEYSGYVKKETMLLVAAIALVAGFLGGVVFTVYKSGPDDVHMHAASPQNQSVPQQSQGIPAQQTDKILALEKEAAVNPNAETWAGLGHAYFDIDAYDKAIDAYNKSLKLKPDDPDIWTDLGVMYRRAGRPDDAVSAFDRAGEISPLHEPSRFNKGVVLLTDKNDPHGAVRAWEELLAINPEAAAPNGRLIKDALKDLKQQMQQQTK